ncbi:MAG: hypothetical protein AB7S75_23065 [Desulfococcaceae bacterium]
MIIPFFVGRARLFVPAVLLKRRAQKAVPTLQMVHFFMEITLRHILRNQQVNQDAVILVKTGINLFRTVPDTDFRRYDPMA